MLLLSILCDLTAILSEALSSVRLPFNSGCNVQKRLNGLHPKYDYWPKLGTNSLNPKL